MAEDRKEPHAVPHVAVEDPDNVPVKMVDGIAVAQVINGATLALTLITARIRNEAGGKVSLDPIVAARLRLDLPTAKALRDTLNEEIAKLEVPASATMN